MQHRDQVVPALAELRLDPVRERPVGPQGDLPGDDEAAATDAVLDAVDSVRRRPADSTTVAFL
jgi:hypothetical protein